MMQTMPACPDCGDTGQINAPCCTVSWRRSPDGTKIAVQPGRPAVAHMPCFLCVQLDRLHHAPTGDPQ